VIFEKKVLNGSLEFSLIASWRKGLEVDEIA
jgi:hypothetical protein